LSLTLKEEHRPRVFWNRVLKTTYRYKRDAVTGGWRKLYNEVFHNFNSSPYFIRVIKSRKRQEEHVASTKEKRNECKILVANLKDRHHLGDLDVYQLIILKWIL
jgi:hypothetical protein